MNFSDLEKISAGKIIQLVNNLPVTHLMVDSRKALVNEGTLFFAIAGSRNDGHNYIAELYKMGIRQFVVEKNIEIEKLPEANILNAPSAVNSLQAIGEAHRKEFQIPVVGICGSNGKTIMKEWLFQLLAQDYSIVKNPGSYNSQIGVPLSIWSMQPHHQLGIFEAGISQAQAMARLEKII